ncbi:MAG: TldD/PmbA family protein [Anaerolineae bacterium]
MDRDRLMSALRGSRADYTEIRIERHRTTQVIFHGKRLDSADVTLDEGGIVRALVHGGGWGISTFNSLDTLPQRIEQAYQAARLVKAEPIALADVPAHEDVIRAAVGSDLRSLPLADKKQLVEGYNEILLSHAGVVDSEAIYADAFVTVTFANSEGAYLVEERPMVTVHLTATARDGNNVQSASDGYSAPAGYEQVTDLDAMAHTVGQRARDLLAAQTVLGGVYPVVCDPKLAGVFVHEAFGHLSEADFVYSNPQAQEMMVLGRRFGREDLTIVDDGTLPGLRGTHRYDDEGTPMRRNELVREGVLVGRLHSRETAARMREPVTGNARATSYRHAPLVRMTNTFVEPRAVPLEDMIADIELGVYACDSMGGETMFESYSFSAGYGYMIRNGRLAEMVKDVILAGDLFSTLQDIDAIGNDLAFSRLGMCGKGPGSLPVETGAPHLRIRNVAIGGR